MFAEARNWKRYWARKVAPHIGTNVLEVGAGIGANIALLNPHGDKAWLALEPDEALAEALRTATAGGSDHAGCEVVAGTLRDVPAERLFDTVLYIDVIEHIEDDRGELAAAAARLAPGGKLIVLAPAHQWLYSPFDESIGHFRRYDRPALIAAAPSTVELVECFYLDSVGLLASAGNRFLLGSGMPTREQIRFWDSVLVNLSIVVDRILGGALGKTVVAVWKRPLERQELVP